MILDAIQNIIFGLNHVFFAKFIKILLNVPTYKTQIKFNDIDYITEKNEDCFKIW